MASRLARNILGKLDMTIQSIPQEYRHINHSGKVGRARPSLVSRTVPHLPTTYTSTRYASDISTEDPAKKARSILDALPGSSLLSKTAILSSGAGLSIWAISNEIYVFNEETMVMIASFSVLWGLFKYGAPVYNEWAAVQIARIAGVLEGAREGHKDAVKSRIDDVKRLGDVVDVTKVLFEVSKVWSQAERQKHACMHASKSRLFLFSPGNRPS